MDITQAQSEERLKAARKILTQKTLSRSSVAKLAELGMAVSVYPRKGVAVVNGFQRYKYV